MSNDIHKIWECDASCGDGISSLSHRTLRMYILYVYNMNVGIFISIYTHSVRVKQKHIVLIDNQFKNDCAPSYEQRTPKKHVFFCLFLVTLTNLKSLAQMALTVVYLLVDECFVSVCVCV